MKLGVTAVNRNHFILFMSFFALIFVQQSSGMMPSKKHQAIAFNRAQAAKAKSMKDPVWVKTADGRIAPIEKWKVDQMNVLQVILEDQGGLNSSKNPVIKPEVYGNEQWFTLQELQLLSDALDAASMGQFEAFYKNISDADVVRMLINAAGKVEATGLSALCGTYFFPKEVQQLVVSDMVQPVVEYLHNNIRPQPLVGGQKAIRSVAFSPDGTKIASGSWSGTSGVALFDVHTGMLLPKLLPSVNHVTSVAFSHDNKKLVVGRHGTDNKLTVWDVQTGKKLLTIVPDGNVRAVAFSFDDTKIVSGCMSSSASVTAWNAEDGTKIWETIGYGNTINSIALSLDGTKIVSGAMGDQDNIMMWNTDDGSLLHNFRGMPAGVYSIAISPDGTKIVYGRRGHLVVLDEKTGKKLYSLSGHSHMVNSIAFRPDGTEMASGGDQGSLILWNASSNENLEKIANLVGHTGNVGAVAFSPDGEHIVSGGQQLLLWQLPTNLIKKIENDGLTLEQARLLYQMYCAAKSGVDMILKKDTLEYRVYDTLPELIKREMCGFFPVKLEECTVEEQQKDSACCIS